MYILPVSNKFYNQNLQAAGVNNGINIYSQNQTVCSQNSPAFTSYGPLLTGYRDVDGVFRKTQINTSLRKDLNCQELAQMIKCKIDYSKFRHAKAKIHCLAAADATEAYAIADGIIGEFGFEKAKECVFPIFVSDINENIMNEFGKAGKIWLHDSEIEKLPNIKKFLVEIARSIKNRDEALYQLKSEFRDCFVFETADLREKLKEFPEPAPGEYYWFVMRNCLSEPFGIRESQNILSEFTKKYIPYPGRAYVVLGDYDIDHLKDTIPGSGKKFVPRWFGLHEEENNTFECCGNPSDRLKYYCE